MCLFEIQVNQWHKLLAYQIVGIVIDDYSRLPSCVVELSKPGHIGRKTLCAQGMMRTKKIV